MSIVAVREVHTGRGISHGDDGVRTTTRVYQVETSSAYDEQLQVLAATGVPRRGDFYSTTDGTIDLTLIVKSVRADQQSDSRLHWTVTAEYSDKRDKGDDQQDPNPLNRPAIIARGFASYQKVAEKGTQLTQGSSDYGNEVPITNSAGMPFIPPPLIDDDRYVVTITRNYPDFDDSFWFQYHNKINSNSYLGADTHTLRLRVRDVPPKITERVNDNDVSYYEVTVDLEYREEGWNYKPLDAGFYEIIDTAQTDPKLRFGEIPDINHQPRITPAPLNGSGVALESNETPVFLEYRLYGEKDFSALGLI